MNEPKTYEWTDGNVTLYLPSLVFGTVLRQDCRSIRIETGCRFAQYADAIKVTWVPARKRNPREQYLAPDPFVVVCETRWAFDPQGMFADGQSVSRYASFDPRWREEFLAEFDRRQVRALFRRPERPIDTVCRLYHEGNPAWVPVPERWANQLLECVPPAFMSGSAFACGEVYDHCDKGPVFICFRRVDFRAGTAECRICTIPELRGDA